MAALALMGGLLYLAVLGFWVMEKIGRFLDGGGLSPYWDEEEMREAAGNEREEPSESETPKAGRTCAAAKK